MQPANNSVDILCRSRVKNCLDPGRMVFAFDVQRLDIGLTILNGDSLCIPNIGSFDGDKVQIHPNKLRLNSVPDGNNSCTFELNTATGDIRISMVGGPWARTSRNGHTYEEICDSQALGIFNKADHLT